MMNIRLLWEEYEDGTIYMDRHFEKAINIGWIKEGLPESNKKLPEKALENLYFYTGEAHFNMIRSIFPCPICGNKITHNGKFIGFGETRIISSSGKTYAARDLLLHFIEEHGYIPPEDFIETLMENPAITEKECSNIHLFILPLTSIHSLLQCPFYFLKCYPLLGKFVIL